MADWSPEALRRARRRFEAEHGDITLEEIGKRVGRVLGEKAPSVAVLSYIFKSGREPKFSLGVALAVVLNADPVSLALPETPKARPMRADEAHVVQPPRAVRKRRA